MSTLKLEVGRCYRGKRPKHCGGWFADDRQIKWMSMDGEFVQYDSPSVADGRFYPKIAVEKFIKWAGRDITDELPEGEWAKWPISKAR